MTNRDPLVVTPPEIQKHPFQIDSLSGPKGPHGLVSMERGFFARVDMPGVAPDALKFFTKPNNVLTFNARAPKKESFPLDESERVYAGFLHITGDPLVTPVRLRAHNGSFFMFFPNSQASLFLLPPPTSAPQISSGSATSNKGQGSSSGKSILEDQGFLDNINLDAMNLKPLGKSPRGSAKAKRRKGSSSSKSTCKAKDAGSRKAGMSKSSFNEDDEAWIRAYIKRNVLQVNILEGPEPPECPEPPEGPEPLEEDSVRVETSPTEQSSHEAPEIAIGSVEEMSNHGPHCQCKDCDSDGICLKTWSTTEDIIGYINGLKIQGPEGVCEKRVVKEDDQYSLYVRADLPGLEPDFCITTVQGRCIMVYGKLPPEDVKSKILGARSYIFFVQLRCSCCKFDNLCRDHEHGVLRLFCKIVPLESGPSAD